MFRHFASNNAMAAGGTLENLNPWVTQDKSLNAPAWIGERLIAKLPERHIALHTEQGLMEVLVFLLAMRNRQLAKGGF